VETTGLPGLETRRENSLWLGADLVISVNREDFANFLQFPD
jgi:hypothetical protein